MANEAQIEIENEAALGNLARAFAGVLRKGDVIFLEGALGVGKTSFARALIRAVAGDEMLEVPSPSFAIIQDYDHDKQPVLHMDLYRLGSTDELLELGWPELGDERIVLVEWPERMGELTFARRIVIKIEDQGGDKRRITITQIGEWDWAVASLI